MTKDKIIAIAIALFAKNGYEGTTLAEIAKGVGIQKPSIYNHYKSKEEIFLTIYKKILWNHIEDVRRLMEGIKDASSEEQLKRILLLTAQDYIDDEEKTTFLRRAVVFPPESLKELVNEEFLLSEEALSAILRSIFTRGIEAKEIREENIEDLIIAYYCLLDGIFIELCFYGTEEMVPRLQNIWKIFWAGISN